MKTKTLPVVQAKDLPSEVLAVQERVLNLPLEDLQSAPWNARKTFDGVALDELLASIHKHGVLTPLLVRPYGAPNGNDIARQHYEIVAGERRYRCSFKLNKEFAPCIVRELTDAQAHEIGLVDNLQREDLPPMEEAEAFRALLAATGLTIESVAAKLGKAPSFIGRRLKLLDLIAPVQEALKAGAIEVGHALELARLAGEQQTRMLRSLDCGFSVAETGPDEDEDDEDGQEDEPGVCRYCGCTEEDACRLDEGNCSWVDEEHIVCSNPDCVAQWKDEKAERVWHATRWSVAQLRSEIARTSLRVLADAPFPLDDELPPMACVECPKRSTNAQLLFEDCGQDTCTDRACFDAKVKVWIKHELEVADREKRKLLMLSRGYASAGSAIPDYSVVVIPEQRPVKPCGSQEEAIWISGEKAGYRTMICRDGKCKLHHEQSHYTGPASNPEKAKADRKKKLAGLNAEKKYRLALFTAIAQAKLPASSLVANEMNLAVCLYAIGRGPGQYEKTVAEALGWPKDIFGWAGSEQLRERLGALTPMERLRVALLAAHAEELAVSEYSVNSKPKDLERLAKTLGLDMKKIRAGDEVKPVPVQEKKAAKPKLAAPAQKKIGPSLDGAPRAEAKKPAAKSILSGAAKKRIAAAQKKRWAAAKKKGGRG